MVEDMFDRIAPRYDLLNRMLTFRMDVAWRRAAVHALELVAGARVLDLACGTGDLCRRARVRRLPPDRRRLLRRDARRRAHRCPLVRADAARLPFPDGALDGLTCGFALRNFVDLDAVLRECARVLRPGGRIALRRRRRARERAGPRRCTSSGSAASCRWSVVSSPTAARTRTFRRPPPISRPAAELLEIVRAAGFSGISHRTLGAGAAQLIAGSRAMSPSDTRLAARRSRLVARTERIADTEHLLDHLGPDGGAWIDGDHGFVTAGVAAVVRPTEAVATLRAIECTSEPDAPLPRALGALPFAGGGRLIVPARIVERDERGRMWRTVIGPWPAGAPRRLAAAPRHAGELHDHPGQQRRHVGRERRGRPRADRRRRRSRRSCSPARSRSTRASRSTSARSSRRCARPNRAASSTPTTASSAPAPSCSCAGRDTTSRPGRWPAPAWTPTSSSGPRRTRREHRFVVEAVVDALTTTCDATVARGVPRRSRWPT